MNEAERITYFAETDFRNKKTKFGIKAADRTRHVYVIGKTGMGKSVLLQNMAIQDIKNGEGFAFADPHGELVDNLLEHIPEERIKDVIYFAPFDQDNPIAFNVMEDVGYDNRHLVVDGLMSAFKKVWGAESWSDRMAYILNNTLLALLEYPGATLLGVQRMYSDKAFRKKVVDNVKDPSVKSFWVDEFAKYTERYAQEATPAISNKIGQFTGNPLIRNIIGQEKSSFDFREAMDNKKIILINLSKGRIGEQNANLLGSMLITKIYLAAMSRADTTPKERENLPQFYFYVDEFQSFANESFAGILSEARKYKLNLTIAHQYIEQMSDEVRAAVLGNVGTMIVFRVGAVDAEVFEKEFAPEYLIEDIVNLGFTQIYLRLMIDGVGSKPFSATTLPPITPPFRSFAHEVIENSRQMYANPRARIEELIKEQMKSETPPVKPKSRDNKTSSNFEKSTHQYSKVGPSVTTKDRPLLKTHQKPFTDIKTSVKPFTPKQKNPADAVRQSEEGKMTSLKDALAKALKEKENKIGQEIKPPKKEAPAPSHSAKSNEAERNRVERNNERGAVDINTEKPKEVPENVLKDIFN